MTTDCSDLNDFSKGDCLSIPPGWLCYLAPELMLRLTPTQQLESDLPFSKASDIYAFGTVWYELLCGEWPYKELPPEAIIWQVGSGIRQPLPTLFSRDTKVLLDWNLLKGNLLQWELVPMPLFLYF